MQWRKMGKKEKKKKARIPAASTARVEPSRISNEIPPDQDEGENAMHKQDNAHHKENNNDDDDDDDRQH